MNSATPNHDYHGEISPQCPSSSQCNDHLPSLELILSNEDSIEKCPFDEPVVPTSLRTDVKWCPSDKCAACRSSTQFVPVNKTVDARKLRQLPSRWWDVDCHDVSQLDSMILSALFCVFGPVFAANDDKNVPADGCDEEQSDLDVPFDEM